MAGGSQLRGLQLCRYQNILNGTSMYEDFTKGVSALTIQTLAVGGYGEVDFQLDGAYIDLMRWINPYNPALMNRVVIFGPAMETVWEGFIYQIDLQVNNTTWSISMQNLFNEVILEYGDPDRRTTTASNLASQAQYGVKVYHEKIGRVGRQGPGNLANRILNEYNLIQHGQESPVGGQMFGRNAKIKCFGYWTTLDFHFWKSGSKGSADTGTLIQYVISHTVHLEPAKAGQFLSTDYSNIKTTNTIIQKAQPEWTNALDYIKKLADYGNSSNRRVFPQVWTNRVFYLSGRPQTIKYFTEVGGLHVFDQYGNIVPLYKVQAGYYIKFRNLSPDINTYTDAVNDIQATFIEETQYDADNDVLTIRPTGSFNANLFIGRLVRGKIPQSL